MLKREWKCLNWSNLVSFPRQSLRNSIKEKETKKRSLCLVLAQSPNWSSSKTKTLKTPTSSTHKNSYKRKRKKKDQSFWCFPKIRNKKYPTLKSLRLRWAKWCKWLKNSSVLKDMKKKRLAQLTRVDFLKLLPFTRIILTSAVSLELQGKASEKF